MSAPGSQLMFTDVKTYLADYLKSIGYDPLPLMIPGPPSDIRLQAMTPNALVFITIGDGAGFTTEMIFDRPFIRIRSISKQNAPDYGEKQALDIDVGLCSVDSNTQIGDTSVLYITRTGGRPVVLEQDKGNRYHWQCTYIAETPSGI